MAGCFENRSALVQAIYIGLLSLSLIRPRKRHLPQDPFASTEEPTCIALQSIKPRVVSHHTEASYHFGQRLRQRNALLGTARTSAEAHLALAHVRALVLPAWRTNAAFPISPKGFAPPTRDRKACVASTLVCSSMLEYSLSTRKTSRASIVHNAQGRSSSAKVGTHRPKLDSAAPLGMSSATLSDSGKFFSNFSRILP